MNEGNSIGERLETNQGELFFECAGSGDPIVLLHGFGLDVRMWDPQFDALRSSFRVIRYDLRGFGQSSLPTGVPYSHEDDLHALLVHLGVSRAHLVGLSMGGRMALRYALAYPNSVVTLVLAESALDGHVWSSQWQTRWQGICQAAKDGRLDDAKRQWLENPLFASARENPSLLALLSQMISDYSGWHWHHKDTAVVPSPVVAERLQTIQMPTLVLAGIHDVADFQSIANALTRQMPAVQRATIQGSGHLINLEAPAEFNSMLLSFFQATWKL